MSEEVPAVAHQMSALQDVLNSHPNVDGNDEKNKLKDDKEGQEEKKSLEEQADSLQMVLPNIYVGSAVAANNLQLLQAAKITHVLAIGWNLKCSFLDQFKSSKR